MDNFESTRNSSGDIGTAELRDKMQKTMQRYAPVYRDDETLKKGIDIMHGLFKDFKNYSLKIQHSSFIIATSFTRKQRNSSHGIPVPLINFANSR